jgi:hypothetical protein
MHLDELQPAESVESDNEVWQAAETLATAFNWKQPGTLDPNQLLGTLGELAITFRLRDEGKAVAGPVLYSGPPEFHPVDLVAWKRRDGVLDPGMKREIRVNIGVRSRWHSALNRPQPCIPYPAERIDSGDVPDYVVAVSVDREARRAYIWGALTRVELIRRASDLDRRSGTPDFYPIPLDAFTKDTWERLIEDLASRP